jgi:hypothetical protein
LPPILGEEGLSAQSCLEQHRVPNSEEDAIKCFISDLQNPVHTFCIPKVIINSKIYMPILLNPADSNLKTLRIPNCLVSGK